VSISGTALGDGPLVSVIINNYNYGRFLRAAIDSVLAQTYRCVEVVVVDDGSTDDSAEVIRSYGDRVNAVFQSNGGQGSACNRGFAESRGDLVIFLDSDDWYYPHAIDTIARQASSGAALIQFRMDLADAQGNPIGLFPPPWVRLEEGDVVPILVSRGHFIGTVTSANAFRRDVLQKVLPMPEVVFTRAVDGYLINSVPFFGRVAAIDRPLGAYRRHEDSDARIRSAAGVDMNTVRKRLDFTTREMALVRRHAEERGIPVAERLEMRYMGHLQLRLFSLRLEPERHPTRNDAPWKLAAWGAWAAVRDPSLRMRRRVFMLAWFLLFGVLPRPAAQWLVTFARSPLAGRFRAIIPG
jgi:glycosyltransferase involved in cell wall biosynthesis